MPGEPVLGCRRPGGPDRYPIVGRSAWARLKLCTHAEIGSASDRVPHDRGLFVDGRESECRFRPVSRGAGGQNRRCDND